MLDKNDAYLKAFSEDGKGKKRGAFRTLFILYKGNYLKLFLSVLFYCIKTAPILYLPIATADIINIITDAVAGNPPENAMLTVALKLGFVVFGCIFINLPLDVLYARFTSSAIRSVEANLRSSIIRKLHMLSISYYKHIQSGRLQSKIMRDVEAVSELSNQLLKNVVAIALSFLFTVVTTSLRDPMMLIFFGLVAPISALITNMFRRKLRESNRKFRNEMENTSASVMEAMELIPVTKAHGVEDTQIQKIDRRFEQVAEDGYRLDKDNAFFGRMIWLSSNLMHIIAFAFSAFLAWKKYISVGDVVLYTGYFSTITNNINGILGLMPIISKGMESVNSVGDVLTAVDIEDNYHKLKPGRLKGSVRFEDVCFKYDDGHDLVLKHFDLDVKAGETLALVGASGCGKSTAINLVIGFGRVTDGRVLIDGMNINNFDLHSYRSQLAVVPQQPILFTGTIRDNITYGADGISEAELRRAVEQANLAEFIDSLPEGLNTPNTAALFRAVSVSA